MKIILTLLGLIFIGWIIWVNSINTNYTGTSMNAISSYDVQIPISNQKFKCDGREYCGQMNSYEEAKYFIHNCPNTKMDGDNDGIPCERQFGRYD